MLPKAMLHYGLECIIYAKPVGAEMLLISLMCRKFNKKMPPASSTFINNQAFTESKCRPVVGLSVIIEYESARRIGCLPSR